MHIRSVELDRFKRFHHLKIELPDRVKLVILVGPNGSGKSSLFEAFNVWHWHASGWPVKWDPSYHSKVGEQDSKSLPWIQQVKIDFYGLIPVDEPGKRKLFYLRSAYRNDPPSGYAANVARPVAAADLRRLELLSQNDAAVSANYQRLVSQAIEDAFANEAGALTLHEFRDKVVRDIRASINRMFPDLLLNDLGNPLNEG